MKVDSIALATEVAQPLTSTQQFKAWEDFMSLDKQALWNGGRGYGDGRDDRTGGDGAQGGARACE